MPGLKERNLNRKVTTMKRIGIFGVTSLLCVALEGAQTEAPSTAKSGATSTVVGAGSHDPAEPLTGAPHPKILPRPEGRVARQSVDEKSMRALIHELVSCGTRLTLSSWDDPKRGIGCGRDKIEARLNEIAKDSGGKLQVVVDKFESTSQRTSGKPIPLENVYAILPGSDEKLAKTIFIVSGHFDSRPS